MFELKILKFIARDNYFANSYTLLVFQIIMCSSISSKQSTFF